MRLTKRRITLLLRSISRSRSSTSMTLSRCRSTSCHHSLQLCLIVVDLVSRELCFEMVAILDSKERAAVRSETICNHRVNDLDWDDSIQRAWTRATPWRRCTRSTTEARHALSDRCSSTFLQRRLIFRDNVSTRFKWTAWWCHVINAVLSEECIILFITRTKVLLFSSFSLSCWYSSEDSMFSRTLSASMKLVQVCQPVCGVSECGGERTRRGRRRGKEEEEGKKKK